MALDPDSPLPLHAQIRQHLAGEIAAGAWQPGEAIPSEPELARRFGVSRMTVRQALRDLSDRGLLLRRQGRATRVAEAPIEQPLGRFYAFVTEMERQGRPHASRVIRVGLERPPAGARAALGLAAGETAATVTLLRLIGDEPLLVETVVVRAPLLPVLHDPALTGRPLYDLLAERAGVRVTRAVERIRPVALPREPARLLGVRQRAAAFAVERTSYAGHTVVEWRETLARGDRYRFVADLPRARLDEASDGGAR